MSKPLFTGTEWTPTLLESAWKEIATIAKDLKIDYYEPQMEIITSEQMLSACSSIGMPNMYEHWSFGKSYISQKRQYEKGWAGLAYEIVINTDPCIVYLMEDNTKTMQTLVMAHAGVGHSAVFKNNYCFTEWTAAHNILDYLQYARNYIADCEERHGEYEVQALLNACHALQDHAVDKYKRKPKPKEIIKSAKIQKWRDYAEEQVRDFDITLPNDLYKNTSHYKLAAQNALNRLEYNTGSCPEDNLLYFVEKYSPKLETWQKEIVRIVRMIAQYFYPQRQCQLLHEGYATFTHYTIMQELYNKGLITEGSYIEFIASHTAVTRQLDYNHPNSYLLF